MVTIVHFDFGGIQPLPEALLRLRAPGSQPLLEDLHTGRFHEDVRGVEGSLPDGLDPLGVDVQDADFVVPLDVFHSLVACSTENQHALNAERQYFLRGSCIIPGAVHVAGELGGFDEVTPLDPSLHLLSSDVMVVLSVYLPWPGFPGRVRDGEAKDVAELGHELFDHGGLAGARWATEHDWTWPSDCGSCRGHDKVSHEG